MVATKNPEIRKAVNTLYDLSANDKVRRNMNKDKKHGGTEKLSMNICLIANYAKWRGK